MRVLRKTSYLLPSAADDERALARLYETVQFVLDVFRASGAPPRAPFMDTPPPAHGYSTTT